MDTPNNFHRTFLDPTIKQYAIDRELWVSNYGAGWIGIVTADRNIAGAMDNERETLIIPIAEAREMAEWILNHCIENNLGE